MFFFTWPVRNPFQLIKTKRIIKQLEAVNSYSAIIGVMLPIEPALAAMSFQNSIIYELDGLTCNPDYRKGIKKYLQHRVRILEKEIFKKAGLIIHLKCNKEWFESCKYRKFASKFVYSDIPNLIQIKAYGENNNSFLELDKVRLVYAGALSKNYRSPIYMIKLLKNIAKKLNIEVFFYSHGDFQQLVKQEEIETNEVIKLMDQVPPDVLESKLMKMDFLLSIGNSLTGNDRSLPSKIITYISTGKPIIHIAGNQNDSAIPYLEKYHLALIINPNDYFDDNVNEVNNFISKHRGESVSFDEIYKMFPENTPEYTADIIIDYINNMENTENHTKS